MTDVTITRLPAEPLFALEIWSNPAKAATRIKKACSISLPAMGQSAASSGLRLMRYEHTVWLAVGDVGKLSESLAEDGAITAIGGGVVRVELAGPRWRRLLMEGGVFDAESPDFAVGSCTATVIDHVNVRLLVTSEASCLVFVPTSFAIDMIGFWEAAAKTLD
jgi:heterotetrameric sarcosine oxidase gamma subunit